MINNLKVNINNINNNNNINDNKNNINNINNNIINSFTSNPQRVFDHYEKIYNNVAYSNKQQNKQQKNLYFALIEKDQKRKQQRKSLQKQINQYQNQQISAFWKNRQNQLKEKQRKNIQRINETRLTNQHILESKVRNNMSKSMVMESQRANYLHDKYFEDQQKYQLTLQKDKEKKRIFLEQGQLYNQYKKYTDSVQKAKLRSEEEKKLQENNQIEQNRLRNLQNWKQKHLQPHNKEAFQVWDQTRRKRLQEEQALDNYIVNQGARQLNQRTYRMKNDQIQRQKAKRQNFINQLQSQLNQDEHRLYNNKKNQQEYQRKIFEQRQQQLEQHHRYLQSHKNQQHRQHLEYLKTQIKPRNLLPEKDKLQYAGIGSPLHIGKVMADDRKKQLEWLEKSLYKDLAV